MILASIQGAGIIPLILMVFALVLFVIAALNRPVTQPHQLQLIGAGLACWVGALIIQIAGGL